MERVYASIEEVGPTLCSVWIHTPRNGADTACAVSGMEDVVHGRVGENLGTLGDNGPTATSDDVARGAKFHILLSLVELIPPDHMPDFRYKVAVHQYQCIKLAGELRHNLPMPKGSVEERSSSSGGTAIWYTTLRRRAQCLPPTEEHLVRQCHYKPRKRAVTGSQQRSAKPERDHTLL